MVLKYNIGFYLKKRVKNVIPTNTFPPLLLKYNFNPTVLLFQISI